MKITKKTTKQVEVDCLVDVLCNKCGESCIPPSCRSRMEADEHSVENFHDITMKFELLNVYGLAEATVEGGYDSHPLSDMTRYTFSLCEGCLHELFKTFKIPVVESEYNFG